MPSNDIRITGWDLPATAGMTYELEFTSTEALTSLSLYVGGTLDDVTDLTGATAYDAVLSGANLIATVSLDVPVGEATPLRLVVDTAVVTAGYLRPSTAGAKNPSSSAITLNTGSASIALSVLGVLVSGGSSGDDNQTAAEVPFTPAGNIAATNVQAALVELDTEKSGTAHTHDDRYFTESEVTTSLAGKSDTGHTHTGTYDPAGTAASAVAAHEADALGVHGIVDTSALLDTGDIGTTVQAYDADLAALAAAGNSAVLAATTASFLTADETKLDGIAAGATTDATVNAHIADAADAHDASAISYVGSTNLVATDVEAALDELDAEKASTGHDHSGAYQPLDADLTALAAAGNSAVLAATTASFLTADETKLDGIEAGATADQTAAEILTAVKTVDGTGSGLDADLLDGNEATAFATSGHNHDSAYAQLDGEYAVNTVATSGATETLTLAPAHNVTMDQNCTFTFPTPTAGHTFTLLLTGAFTPTFPASVDWNAGTPPTYASPSKYAFETVDGGTTWVGTLIASALA